MTRYLSGFCVLFFLTIIGLDAYLDQTYWQACLNHIGRPKSEHQIEAYAYRQNDASWIAEVDKIDGWVVPGRPQKVEVWQKQHEWTTGHVYRIQGTMRLQPNLGLHNGDFHDEESLSWQKRRMLKGKPVGVMLVLHESQPLRSRLIKTLEAHISDIKIDKLTRSYLMALLTGQKDKKFYEPFSVWSRTGTAHLFAISGLHIGTCFAAVMFVARLARCSTRTANMIGLCAAWLYAWISGFEVPSIRALIFIMLSISLSMMAKRMRRSQIWWMAFGIVLCMDYRWLWSASFWLSFGAVAFVMARPACSAPSKYAAFQTSWRVFWGMVPLGLIFFHSIPWLSMLCNAFAIPALSFLVIVPLLHMVPILMISDDLFAWGIQLVAWNFEWIRDLLAWADSLGLYSDELYWPWTMKVIFSFLCVGIALGGRWWAGWALWCVMAVVCAQPKITRSDLKLVFFDVGQGAAALVMTKEHALLYDTGPMHHGHSVADRAIIPWLKAHGIRHLDTMIVSHGDLDHQGGVQSILKHVVVDEVFTGEPERLDVPSMDCAQARYWEWDGVHFELTSVHRYGRGRNANANDQSCVLKVTHPQARALFLGDMGKQALRALLEQEGTDLKTDILLVPHHGSRHSLVPEVVAMMAPQHTVFSAGCMNSYGHPGAEVVSAYAPYGQSWWTSVHGLIEFDIKHKHDKPVVHTAREGSHHGVVPDETRLWWCHGMGSGSMRASETREEQE